MLEAFLVASLTSPVRACRVGAAASLCRLLARDAADADDDDGDDGDDGARADEGARLRAAMPPGPPADGAADIQPLQPDASLSRASLDNEPWGCWLRADVSALPPRRRRRARAELTAAGARALSSEQIVECALSWQAADHRDGAEAMTGVDAMMDRLSHSALDVLTDGLAASAHALGLELSAAAAAPLAGELSAINVGLWHALCCAVGGETFATGRLLPAVRALLFACPGAPPPRDHQLVAAEAFAAVGLAAGRWVDGAASVDAERALGELLVDALNASTECVAEWSAAVELVCADAHPLRSQWFVDLALAQALRLSASSAADAPRDAPSAAGAAAAGADLSLIHI